MGRKYQNRNRRLKLCQREIAQMRRLKGCSSSHNQISSYNSLVILARRCRIPLRGCSDG